MTGDLSSFKVLTFDCYGTLIDWETGIHAALGPLLKMGGVALSRDDVLAAFAEHESAQQAATPEMPYSELLTKVHRQLADLWAVGATDAVHHRFGASVPDWPAFSDAAPSLRYLQKYYRLVILSNVDHKSFEGSNRRLKVTFDAIYTAQDIGSYKPARQNFDFMLAQLAERGFKQDDILHVAQSLFHDHVPAKTAGLACAWIDRRHDRHGWGATPAPTTDIATEFRFNDLTDFVDAHRRTVSARPIP